MKTCKNKKLYNFKHAHKCKKRTSAAKIVWKSNSREYRRILRKKYRAECKVVLLRKLKGQLIEFSRFRKTLKWEY